GLNFYESRDFVRLQDVRLGYRFPDALMEKMNLQALELYVSGRNLYTWTDWSGWDPENRSGHDSAAGGFATPRAVSLGLSISF
ncbi:MAG: hypothetical protein AAFX53_07375, partial [Bacteroidota bacterium]